jgi:hypothetical protein
MSKTTIVDINTGKITTQDWTQEEIDARKERFLPAQWKNLREHRNKLLIESDSMLLIDRWNLLSESKKQEWLNYRQSLRDLPDDITDPFNVTWPTKPE